MISHNSTLRTKVNPSKLLRAHFLTLARRILSGSPDSGEAFSIGVTSLRRQEGKSTVALNLAAALAGIQNQPILLVEADFGNPSLSKKKAAAKGGLSDIIGGSGTPQECIASTSVDQLYFMGCGTLNAREILEQPLESIHTLNSELQADFRMAIYDLPVADELNLSLLLAQHLDGTVIVVDSKHVETKAIERFKRRAVDFNADVIGIVLNKAPQGKRN